MKFSLILLTLLLSWSLFAQEDKEVFKKFLNCPALISKGKNIKPFTDCAEKYLAPEMRKAKRDRLAGWLLMKPEITGIGDCHKENDDLITSQELYDSKFCYSVDEGRGAVFIKNQKIVNIKY